VIISQSREKPILLGAKRILAKHKTNGAEITTDYFNSTINFKQHGKQKRTAKPNFIMKIVVIDLALIAAKSNYLRACRYPELT
jgi:hypothetical protein